MPPLTGQGVPSLSQAPLCVLSLPISLSWHPTIPIIGGENGDTSWLWSRDSPTLCCHWGRLFLSTSLLVPTSYIPGSVKLPKRPLLTMGTELWTDARQGRQASCGFASRQLDKQSCQCPAPFTLITATLNRHPRAKPQTAVLGPAFEFGHSLASLS